MNIKASAASRVHRTVIALLVLATTALAMTTATAGTEAVKTRAEPVEFGLAAPTHSIKSTVTGRCLDDSVAYGLRTFPCNGLAFQKFTFWRGPYGTYLLQNQATKRCLYDGLTSGIQARTCTGSSNQHWYLITWARGGPYGFSNRYTRRCIDTTSFAGVSILQTLSCSTVNRQKFYLR
ncbi:RICIN domain-containing protein [Streptomyces sp. NPDC059582]|uniref:RICIN domain-containing protein n=1 Tax=Streptomyces sp. NPDC059582 TaxID=3346875 RepID=UPI0036BF21D9